MVNVFDVSLLNILNEGYHSTVAEIKKGGGGHCSPGLKILVCKFTSVNVLESGDIASDRRTNGHAVNICKNSRILQKGLRDHVIIEILSYICLAWIF